MTYQKHWVRRLRFYAGLSVFVLALLFSLGAVHSLAQTSPQRTIHVFVALADNQHQGIVPVPARLGNGLDPANNLYWGAAAGVKTFFARSAGWKMLGCGKGPKPEVLEQCIFQHRAANVYLVADAYRGDQIRQALIDFFEGASGAGRETVTASLPASMKPPAIPGRTDLVAYVGHDGLMDFQLPFTFSKKGEMHRDAIILACASRQYFSELLRPTGAVPLLWTTNLMAPEAYTLESALEGWVNCETNEAIHERAAIAYNKYQKCGLRGARKLFATGW